MEMLHSHEITTFVRLAISFSCGKGDLWVTKLFMTGWVGLAIALGVSSR